MFMANTEFYPADPTPAQSGVENTENNTDLIRNAEREVELALAQFGRMGSGLSNSKCVAANRVIYAIITLRQIAPPSNNMRVGLARNNIGSKMTRIRTRCAAIGLPR